MKRIVANPARTAVQVVPAFVITDVVDSFVHHLDNHQYGVMVAAVTLVLSTAQNLLESKWGQALFKGPVPKDEQI